MTFQGLSMHKRYVSFGDVEKGQVINMKLVTSAYNQIKQDVFQAKYKPNELITEKQIMEKYGISKVTSGEALHRLCSEGHLTNYPRSGYMVTVLTAREMQQLRRTRIVLESLVLSIICEEASDEAIDSLNNVFSIEPDQTISASNFRFHMALVTLTNDAFLINTLEMLLGALTRVDQYVSPDYRALWQDHHKNIINALAARNLEKAQAALAEDLSQ